ncbi:sensor histidine kinase [Sphingomonas sp. 28-62-11]|uniref:sensor histidine kinase n=1 Tax=Sphingomonas sp. 28-62-11 TaxID=1970432 RepID=UPI000BD7C096|nr:MAG: histidine kinase [Sphingomonas sp. 28-62-11]
MSDDADRIDELMGTTDLANALGSDRFKQFLDHVPVAIAVSELHPSEVVTYANLEFARLTGQNVAEIEGKSWRTLPGIAAAADDERLLRDAIENDADYIGEFRIDRETGTIHVDVWSNTIEDDSGTPIYRLVALGSAAGDPDPEQVAKAALRAKDNALRELQHRVKNNLQMITALIRLEARNVPDDETGERFDRLAGRINALATLYDALSNDNADDTIDLGVYLAQIASSVMQAHAVEGIRLDMTIDTWPVSVDVAMPTGLVVNEVLTNALKHAFTGRDAGTIKLHSLIDDEGCHITIADDGIGLPAQMVWPERGKLSAIIVQSLRQNASARIKVDSAPGQGTKVVISFKRAAAAPTGGEASA